MVKWVIGKQNSYLRYIRPCISYVCVCVCVCLFAITRNNQSFCRQIAGYRMGVGDHRLMVKGITGKHNLIEVHSTMHLMHPNYCLLYTSPSPRDATLSRMPSSA